MSERLRSRRSLRLASDIRFGDIFKIGIGPSSSHTVGPMHAAAAFARRVIDAGPEVTRVQVTLYGSLAWTGSGHGTDLAIMIGLEGGHPETIAPEGARARCEDIRTGRSLILGGERVLWFDPEHDIVFDKRKHRFRHPNTLEFQAFGDGAKPVLSGRYYSVGGGMVETDEDEGRAAVSENPLLPFSFSSMAELLEISEREDITIPEIAVCNESARCAVPDLDRQIHRIADGMLACIERGISKDGRLPGPLKVERRARTLLEASGYPQADKRTTSLDTVLLAVSAYAISVNEENAAGGRVVTAPTNGAAGVVPAVLRYLKDFCDPPETFEVASKRYLVTAFVIGALVKANASISGAEAGCQGEVGSASAMAAAGLVAALGGTSRQIEHAAEIALEHHLGMTCDPVGGLVQIPCIERNAIGAIKAVTAATLALQGDGRHVVSLDQVIETMRQTGNDMSDKYRETSRGGLAVNVPEC